MKIQEIIWLTNMLTKRRFVAVFPKHVYYLSILLIKICLSREIFLSKRKCQKQSSCQINILPLPRCKIGQSRNFMTLFLSCCMVLLFFLFLLQSIIYQRIQGTLKFLVYHCFFGFHHFVLPNFSILELIYKFYFHRFCNVYHTVYYRN